MEIVEVVEGEDVDQLLDIVGREEVPAAVEHKGPVGEFGIVEDRPGRQCEAVVSRRFRNGQSLDQGLDAVQEALGAAAHEGDGCRLYAQTVTLRPLEILKAGSHVGIDAQENIVPAGRTRCGADAAAGRLLQLPGQQVRGEAELLVTFRIADDRPGRKDERGFFPGEEILRQRADQGKVAGQDFRPVAAGKQDQRRHQDGAGQETESMTGHYFTAGLT